MLERLRLLAVSLPVLALTACAAPGRGSTGGTDIAPGPFGRGVFTVNESGNYDSTNISLVGSGGEVLSESFIAVGLSGDIAAPSMPGSGDDIVLLDRWYSLVTWVDVRTGEIREQFHVDGDELARNPWDYLPVAPDKAYVTRYDPWPGSSEHGDVIVVNPQTADVLTTVGKRIDVAQAVALPDGYVVRPARGVVVGDRAYLVTVNATPEYQYTDSHVVVMDTNTDEITGVRELTGLHDCTAIAVSPDREELAIACAGDLQANGDLDQARSGLVVLARETLEEKNRYTAAQLGDGVLGFSLSYVAPGSVLVLVTGSASAGVPDAATLLHLGSGETRHVLTASPFNLGHVLCPERIDGQTGPEATPPACFVTDAEQGMLLRFPVENGDLGAGTAIDVDDVVGLPPRYLGQF